MADHSDRDRSIEHLLRQTPPQSSSAPSAACVDAERLAAWAEGSLRGEEAKQVEVHLADCARCQAMAAVFAESAPALPVLVPFWKHWSVRWLLPLWAASAFVLAWAFVVREQPDEPAATMARVEQAEAPPVTPAPDVTPEAAPGAPPASAAAPASEPAREAEARRFEQSSALKAEPPVASSDTAEQADMIARQAPMAAPEAPSPPPPASSSAFAPPPPPPAPSAPAIQTQSGERSTAAAQPGRGQNNVMMDGISVLEPGLPIHARIGGPDPIVFGPPLEPRATLAGEPGATAARELSPPPRWRIASDGRVDRSADGGASWSPVPLESSPVISAGSAPSALVCWLAGREGAVFRATDGVTFQRVSFPEAIPLVSVQAVDAAQATIVSDDGRVFTTTNGGGEWRERP